MKKIYLDYDPGFWYIDVKGDLKMNKKLLNIFLITIIVSFILLGCSAIQERANERSSKKSDDKISIEKMLHTSEEKLIFKDKCFKNNNKMDTYLKDDNKGKSTPITINNSSVNYNPGVFPKNNKPVDNLNSNIKQSDKKVIPKQPIIKVEPKNEDKQTEPEALIEEIVRPEEIIPPEVVEDDNALCDNAWFDETKPCDYIPDNLKPTDELGRSVPHFWTSIEAWNWGVAQIEDDSSKYSCRGFTRMDGYQNDGKQFFFAYLKVCEAN